MLRRSSNSSTFTFPLGSSGQHYIWAGDSGTEWHAKSSGMRDCRANWNNVHFEVRRNSQSSDWDSDAYELDDHPAKRLSIKHDIAKSRLDDNITPKASKSRADDSDTETTPRAKSEDSRPPRLAVLTVDYGLDEETFYGRREALRVGLKLGDRPTYAYPSAEEIYWLKEKIERLKAAAGKR